MVIVFIVGVVFLLALGLLIYLIMGGTVTVAIAIVAVVITVCVCASVVYIVKILKSKKKERT